MPSYDIERFLTDMQACLAANLNPKLSAIDTEKGDFTLAQVAADAYFLQDLSDGTPKSNPFVIYGEVDEPVSESLGPTSSTKYTVGVEVVLADSGGDSKIKLRMLRYRRALTEVIQENWDRIGQMAMKARVKGTTPTAGYDSNGQVQARAIGVLIEVVLA